MDATITLRQGCPPDEAAMIQRSTPALDPDAWMTRDVAGEKLGVSPRTIDRYIRRKELSFYRGPVPKDDGTPGGGNGVRIWKDDVTGYPYRHPVKVVAQ